MARLITTKMVAAYRRMMALRVPGDNVAQSLEWREAAQVCSRLLLRPPWKISVLQALAEDEPETWYSAEQVRDWHEARAIGLALQEAAKA